MLQRNLNRPNNTGFLQIVVALGSLAAVTLAQATTAVAPAIATTRIVVPTGAYAPAEPGVELLHDYGTFLLYRVDAAHLSKLAIASKNQSTVVDDSIEFDTVTVEPTQDADPAVPAQFETRKTSGASLQLVQFVGPVVNEWLNVLQQDGVRIVQYIPNNAYIVQADEAAIQRIAQRVAQGGVIQYTGSYSPYMKLSRPLADRVAAGLTKGKVFKATVSVVTYPGNADVKAQVLHYAQGSALSAWADLSGIEAVRMMLNETDLAAIAQLPGVFAIEEYAERARKDERQDQIVAGILNAGGSQPSAPGYLDFLAARGFSTNPADYPIVDVSDDGLGNGSATNGGGDATLTKNGDGVTTRLAYVTNCGSAPTASGIEGHGHLNTNIVGGYDVRLGFPYKDTLGYSRGLGLSPYTRLGHSKVFNDAGSFDTSLAACGSNTTPGLAKAVYAQGARISSNSWSATSNAYDAEARAYDVATRDADTTAAGEQSMLFVFAAGNAGNGASTIGTPSTAKNILTVGASENYRPSDEDGLWTDGCAVDSTGADNAMDVIAFSSRGPVKGARIKPEIIAPGTHIHGTASPSPLYNGNGVCDAYRPSGQYIFASSSGTSHSTPAIAGTASLVYYWLQNKFSDALPSPAMLKAYLIAHPTYLTGVGANDKLPSNVQGYGMPNLSAAFDNTPKVVQDQTTVFTTAGATATLTAQVADPSKPVRIVMVYSDAPSVASTGSTGGILINNLDLKATIGASSYVGNQFNATGGFSTAGATVTDTKNNYEAIFVPAGATGAIAVTVTATALSGKANSAAATNNQDFALVCYNCTSTADFSVSSNVYANQVCAGTPATWNLSLAAQLGFSSSVNMSAAGLPAGATPTFTPSAVVPSGATTLSVSTTGLAAGTYPFSTTGTSGALIHSAPMALSVTAAAPVAPALSAPVANAYGVSPTPAMSWAASANARSYLLEVSTDPTFAATAFSVTLSTTSFSLYRPLTPNTRYYWRVTAQDVCGNGVSAVQSFVTSAATCQVFNSTNVPKTIPTSGTITSTLTSTLSGTLGSVSVVSLTGTHTYFSDLSFSLINPSNTNVKVMASSCGSTSSAWSLGLDDQAAGNPGTWNCTPAPIGGGLTYKPSNPLAGLINSPANGTWTLSINDAATPDGGTLSTWGLNLCVQSAPNVALASNDSFSVHQDASLTTAAPGVLGNDLPTTGATVAVLAAPTHGAFSLAANGSFSYTPSAGYCGADSFTYTETSGTSNSTATAAIDVVCSPTGVAAAIELNQGALTGTLVGGATSVLATASGPSGHTLTAVLNASPTHGTLTLNSDGTFSYLHDGSSTTSDSFTYNVCDTTAVPTACSAPVTVTISIDLNPLAACSLRKQVVGEGDTLNLDLSSLFTDPASGTLSYSSTGLPATLALDPATHILSGTLASGSASTTPYNVVFSAQNIHGGAASKPATFLVLPNGGKVFRDEFEGSVEISCP